MIQTSLPLRRLLRAAPWLVPLILASCTWPPPTGSTPIPPIPGGMARVWFYRDLDPNDSLATPLLRLNNTPVAVSQPGGALYRDVAPGQYHITVDSMGTDVNQSRDVALGPGQEVYAKVVSLNNWYEGGGGERSSGWHRPTFYVWTYPAEIARPVVLAEPFFGGGTAGVAAQTAQR
jgi:hypothetical protein